MKLYAVAEAVVVVVVVVAESVVVVVVVFVVIIMATGMTLNRFISRNCHCKEHCDFLQSVIFPTSQSFIDFCEQLTDQPPPTLEFLKVWKQVFDKFQESEDLQALFWRFFFFIHCSLPWELPSGERQVFRRKMIVVAGTLAAADLPFPTMTLSNQH